MEIRGQELEAAASAGVDAMCRRGKRRLPAGHSVPVRLRIAIRGSCAQQGLNLVGWKEPTGTDGGNRREPQGVAAR